jgi:hypothetical protein
VSVNDSANIESLVSRSSARSKVRDALRLFIGRGRRYSVKQVCNATGVPDRLIECAMCDPESGDYRALSLEHLLSLSQFLGAAFTSEWMLLACQGTFELPDCELPAPGTLAALDAQDTAEIVTRAADGEFCEDDKQALKAVGHREIQRGMKLVAIGGGKAAA